MTLPASGSISMSQIAAELSIGASGLNLNDSRVRGLAGIGSGTISFSSLRGKSKVPPLAVSIVADTTNQSAYVFDAPGYPSISITAYPSGGTGSYTYHWQFTGGQTGGLDTPGSNSQTVYVGYYAGQFSNGSQDFYIMCTIKDSAGSSINSRQFYGILSWNS